ncbi:hypothetical protein JMUB3936_p1004 (plasmid) [Leptotrichia wadei]|jgi:hypothetical protein|uniref:Uncharacterized protein n=1 Tax=Leptotrichia wadei TaxID=157687 RepID=A0A510KW71_9FUSO|nr:hypothetical protein [Leptotrichia wadei]BBM55932.1 hypothetical protein JMUB3936_p1004 [Leptotrichia wadei]
MRKELKKIEKFVKQNCGNFAYDEEIGTKEIKELKGLTIISEYRGWDQKYGEPAFETKIFNKAGIELAYKEFLPVFSYEEFVGNDDWYIF